MHYDPNMYPNSIEESRQWRTNFKKKIEGLEQQCEQLKNEMISRRFVDYAESKCPEPLSSYRITKKNAKRLDLSENTHLDENANSWVKDSANYGKKYAGKAFGGTHSSMEAMHADHDIPSPLKAPGRAITPKPLSPTNRRRPKTAMSASSFISFSSSNW